MKVRCTRKNVNDLKDNQSLKKYYNHIYDRVNPECSKNYSRTDIGYESVVFAIIFRGQYVWYYIRKPDSSDIIHVPNACFEIIDNRLSKYWCLSTKRIDNYDRRFYDEPFIQTTIAIKEWVEEPWFLEKFVDEQPREFKKMNEAAMLIEVEFS